MPRQSTSHDIRHRVAAQAAQLIVESGDLSYAQARDKAAKQLNCKDRRQLPDNKEIETALQEHLLIFQADGQQGLLHQYLQNAYQAMQTFNAFQPLLIGPALSGITYKNLPISLILFSDAVETVVVELLERRIPWSQNDIRVDYPNKKRVGRTLLSFLGGDDQFELLILPVSDRHNLPLDPIQGRPQKGASISKLQKMLDSD